MTSPFSQARLLTSITLCAIGTGACAGRQTAELPRVTPVYIPLYSISNPPPCVTRILGREQFRWDRSQHLNDIVWPKVQRLGGNAAVEVVMEPDRETTEPPTHLSERLVAFSPAVVDWTDCKPGTRKRKSSRG